MAKSSNKVLRKHRKKIFMVIVIVFMILIICGLTMGPDKTWVHPKTEERKPPIIEQNPNSAKPQPQIQTIDEEAINAPLAKLNKKNKELIKFLSTDYQVVYKTEEIQSNILNALYEKFAGKKIANPDEEFNPTDVIYDENIPQRRLVFAGSSSNSWFVCYEHGGYGYHCHLIIFSTEKEKVQIMFNGSHFYKPQNLKQLKQWVSDGKFDQSYDW